MVVEKYCTKDNPMPLSEGPLAVQKGIMWHHDDIIDEDPDCMLDSRYVPFRCGSCGYHWWADLGD